MLLAGGITFLVTKWLVTGDWDSLHGYPERSRGISTALRSSARMH